MNDALDTNKVCLRIILGNDVDGLTEGERRVAERMLDWAVGLLLRRESFDPKKELVDLVAMRIREIVPKATGLDWETEIASTGKGERVTTEVRYICFKIMWELTRIPKNHIAPMLGIQRDHSSVCYALKTAEQWVEVDRSFRNKYERLYSLVRDSVDGYDGHNTKTAEDN